VIYACIKAAADAADPYKSIIIIAFQMAMKNSMAAPEMPPNSISEHLFFKIFLGGACPQTSLAYPDRFFPYIGRGKGSGATPIAVYFCAFWGR